LAYSPPPLESLEELTELTVPLFSGVKDLSLAIPEWPKHPYGLEQLGYTCAVAPVKDIRNFNITWSIPDLHEFYKTNVSVHKIHLHSLYTFILTNLNFDNQIYGFIANICTLAKKE